MPEDIAPPFNEPSAEDLPALLEALLFVSDGPVTESTLTRAMGTSARKIVSALAELENTLQERGVRLQRGPEGAQLVTAPHTTTAVEHFLGLESGRKLSTAALETLAVIAYRQPVTRAAIEAIRGTSSSAVLATLRARGLIARIGRARSPGRAALYGTTQHFLEHFGLQRFEDLPGIEAFADRLRMPSQVKDSSLFKNLAAVKDKTEDESSNLSTSIQSESIPTQSSELPGTASTIYSTSPELPGPETTNAPQQPGLNL